ncbi:MAG TPA: sulfite oxidase-like oxidoreductase [Candidatus Acidoferrales bacterium]|nr:sulfite oxidase-like oxidoreductase [Candidatus Acidoferrales bacterium]
MLFGESSERRQLERQMREAGRLPPGQSLTLKWPVLHAGSVPRFDATRWDFTISGLVGKSVRLSWDEFNRLPQKVVIADMHCVTRWSRFDNRWEGVPVADVLRLVGVRPEARFALVHAEQGYSANIPLDDLLRPESLLALRHDGEPLTAEHGYPLRLVVPHLYAWKSVKWVRGIELLAKDEPGFWEQNGYNMYGDPWKEQRYSGG